MDQSHYAPKLTAHHLRHDKDQYIQDVKRWLLWAAVATGEGLEPP